LPFIEIVSIISFVPMSCSLIRKIACSIFVLLVTFCALALALLPYDIRADEKNIYIHKYIKKYKVSFNDIKMIELFMGPHAPMLRISKYNEERIIQSLGIMEDKNTELLISIFKLHNIEIHYTMLNP